MKSITLETVDGVRIAADVYSVTDPKGWVVFLHMMPATKESWRLLAQACAREGFAGIAIDLRGHGESRAYSESRMADGTGKELDYITFTDEEHQKSILDVEAAVQYVRSQGGDPRTTAFVGASIGANLALQYIYHHPEFFIAVCLSPGLDYRGIVTESFARMLHADARVLLVSSSDDGDTTRDTEFLYHALSDDVRKDMICYASAGHGTTMIVREPMLIPRIARFIATSV